MNKILLSCLLALLFCVSPAQAMPDAEELGRILPEKQWAREKRGDFTVFKNSSGVQVALESRNSLADVPLQAFLDEEAKGWREVRQIEMGRDGDWFALTAENEAGALAYIRYEKEGDRVDVLSVTAFSPDKAGEFEAAVAAVTTAFAGKSKVPAASQPTPGTEKLASFDRGKASRFGFGNILMGAWVEQDGWVNAEELQSSERFRSLRIWGGEECRVFGMDGLKSEGIISAIHSEHPGEFPHAHAGVPSFDVHTPNGVLSYPSGQLAILCPWDPQPRKAAAMNTGNATYQGIAKKFLAGRGLKTESPMLVQLFKVDLEGDGVAEVLICAQNIVTGGEGTSFAADTPLASGMVVPNAAQKGAYSLVFLRKLVDGKVLELPLHEYLSLNGSTPIEESWSPPLVGRICQFADLNGDGVLEIVLGTACYEGYAYHVFEVKGGSVREVLVQGEGN